MRIRMQIAFIAFNSIFIKYKLFKRIISVAWANVQLVSFNTPYLLFFPFSTQHVIVEEIAKNDSNQWREM